jgi:hypothetical protein
MQIFSKEPRPQATGQLMCVTVASDFVTCRGDLRHQLGLPFCDTSQDEESGLRLILRKDVQHASYRLRQTQIQRIPSFRRKRRTQILHLKPRLDIKTDEDFRMLQKFSPCYPRIRTDASN